MLPQPLCRAVTPVHDCIPVSGVDEAIRAWHRPQKCLGHRTPAVLQAPSQTQGCFCETPTFSSSHCRYFLAAKEGILLQVFPSQELMQSVDNQGMHWRCSHAAPPLRPLPLGQQEPQFGGLVPQGTKSDPCNTKEGQRPGLLVHPAATPGGTTPGRPGGQGGEGMVRRQSRSLHSVQPWLHRRCRQRERPGVSCLAAGECAGPQCLVSQAPLWKDWLWATTFAELYAWSLGPACSGWFVHSLASLGCMA